MVKVKDNDSPILLYINIIVPLKTSVGGNFEALF